MLKAHGKLHD